MSYRVPLPGYGANIELVRRYQGGDAGAAEELLALNAPMLAEMVRPFLGRVTSMEFDDLAQEARLGLLVAARKFECDSGNRFSTYAYWWVRQSIQRAVDNQDRMIRWPSHVTNRQRARHTRVPEVLPVAASLDDPNSESGATFADLVAAPGNLEEEVMSREMAEWALSCLNSRERLVLDRRMEGWALAEIGTEIGVTRERVRQIEGGAALRVRRRLIEAGYATSEGPL